MKDYTTDSPTSLLPPFSSLLHHTCVPLLHDGVHHQPDLCYSECDCGADGDGCKYLEPRRHPLFSICYHFNLYIVCTLLLFLFLLFHSTSHLSTPHLFALHISNIVQFLWCCHCNIGNILALLVSSLAWLLYKMVGKGLVHYVVCYSSPRFIMSNILIDI